MDVTEKIIECMKMDGCSEILEMTLDGCAPRGASHEDIAFALAIAANKFRGEAEAASMQARMLEALSKEHKAERR